jgi:hypothetical protein
MDKRRHIFIFTPMLGGVKAKPRPPAILNVAMTVKAGQKVRSAV